ncbi:MAG: ThiF family adenylyltransferase, partial [Clostridiales bacterium]|nr:ThiF family adenylyltransferase [Clostridiales bacterium]
MDDRFLRTEILTGKKALERLKNSYVAVFGIGGVGGYAAETLARSGIGRFDLIDNDRIDITNINRQIIADSETTGRLKTEVMAERIKKINPDAEVNVYNMFF